jgi:hypothetical protein
MCPPRFLSLRTPQEDIRIAIYVGILTGLASLFVRYVVTPKPKPTAAHLCDNCKRELRDVERAVEMAGGALRMGPAV